MAWSRLEGTQIWTLAKAQYFSDPRRKYHVWDHVQQLYFHAEHTFRFEYDDQLDRAILGHDAIYDDLPEKERRSADWLMHNDPLSTQTAYDHIMRTAGHVPGKDNRILLLDLADFIDFERTARNRALLEEESMELYGISRRDFAKANVKFLDIMASSYTPEALSGLPDWEREAFARISQGIEFSASLSRKAAA